MLAAITSLRIKSRYVLSAVLRGLNMEWFASQHDFNDHGDYDRVVDTHVASYQAQIDQRSVHDTPSHLPLRSQLAKIRQADIDLLDRP